VVKRALVVFLVLASCCSSERELSPTTVSQRGGEELHVWVGEHDGDGGVVVLVDGVPAHSALIMAPGLVRARLPSVPRPGEVDVEVLVADGTSVRVARLEVTAPLLDVRTPE
jgi:hypothetical protein